MKWRLPTIVLFALIIVVSWFLFDASCQPKSLLTDDLPYAFIAEEVKFEEEIDGVLGCTMYHVRKSEMNSEAALKELKDGRKLVFVFNTKLLQQIEFDLKMQRRVLNATPRVFVSFDRIQVKVLSLNENSGRFEVVGKKIRSVSAWAKADVQNGNHKQE